MTLRLVLVGIVAALGLTIPQLSNQKNGIGAAQTTTAGQFTKRVVGSDRRPARGVAVDHRNLRSSNFYSRRQFQPVAYGSGVVRPASKLVDTFWQIPSGSRIVPTTPPVVAASHAAKPARSDLKPIEAITVENQPRRSLEPMMDVYEAITRIANRPAPTQSTTIAADSSPSTKAASNHVSVMALVRVLKSNAEAVAGNVSRRIDQTGRILWESLKTLHADLRAKNELRVATMVAPVAPRSAEPATIPDDVFAPVIAAVRSETAQLANLPDDVFAPVIEAPRAEPTQLANLPDDVFAPVIEAPRAEPAQLANLPEDVFAPEIAAVRSEPAQLANLPEDVFAPEIVVSSPVVASAGVPELPTQAKPVAQRPENLTKAVSLTRDAAVAWMKLLSGPAVVTLHR